MGNTESMPAEGLYPTERQSPPRSQTLSSSPDASIWKLEPSSRDGPRKAPRLETVSNRPIKSHSPFLAKSSFEEYCQSQSSSTTSSRGTTAGSSVSLRSSTTPPSTGAAAVKTSSSVPEHPSGCTADHNRLPAIQPTTDPFMDLDTFTPSNGYTATAWSGTRHSPPQRAASQRKRLQRRHPSTDQLSRSRPTQQTPSSQPPAEQQQRQPAVPLAIELHRQSTVKLGARPAQLHPLSASKKQPREVQSQGRQGQTEQRVPPAIELHRQVRARAAQSSLPSLLATADDDDADENDDEGEVTLDEERTETGDDAAVVEDVERECSIAEAAAVGMRLGFVQSLPKRRDSKGEGEEGFLPRVRVLQRESWGL